MIVIVVYQQVENSILQPTIIGKATNVSGFVVLVSVLVFVSLFGIIADETTASRRALMAADDATREEPA